MRREEAGGNNGHKGVTRPPAKPDEQVEVTAERRVIMVHGINVMGALGVLKVMYRKGRVELRNVLDEFPGHGFWMDADLYRKILEDRILRDAGGQRIKCHSTL